jgi:hypothetical protein
VAYTSYSDYPQLLKTLWTSRRKWQDRAGKAESSLKSSRDILWTVIRHQREALEAIRELADHDEMAPGGECFARIWDTANEALEG